MAAGEPKFCNHDYPAFPTRTDQPFGDGRLDIGGMTLRDYFAAKAIECFADSYTPKETARRCYEYADAMLAERSKS